MEKSSDILAGGCRAGNSDGGAENRSLLQTRKMLIGQILNFSMYAKNLQNQKEMGGLDEKSSLHVFMLC